MTRKDFNELAEQLAIVRRELNEMTFTSLERAIAESVFKRSVEAVILSCRATSAHFNTQQFRDAINR